MAVFFVSCEKDEIKIIDQANEPIHITTKNFHEFLLENDFKKALNVWEQFNATNMKGLGAKGATAVHYRLDTTIVKEIKKGSLVSYTFLLLRDSLDRRFFENLIVQIDSAKEVRAYIRKYSPDKERKKGEYFSGERLLFFLQPLENNTSGLVANPSDNCVTTIYCSWGDEGIHVAGPNCTEAYMYSETVCDGDDSGGGGGYIPDFDEGNPFTDGEGYDPGSEDPGHGSSEYHVYTSMVGEEHTSINYTSILLDCISPEIENNGPGGDPLNGNSGQGNWGGWLYQDDNNDDFPDNFFEIRDLANFLTDNDCSEEAQGFGEDAAEVYANNGMVLEGVDQDFDSNFWNDPNLSFPQQSLPSFDDFNDAYPKLNGEKMPAVQVWNLIGGNVLSLAIANNWTNACAARVSRALNYSGVTIPQIANQTFEGADGKYYFLGARALFEWMKKTFGSPDIILSQSQVGSFGSGFLSATNGSSGIYIMIPNYPAQFGASGHADIFNGSSFNGNGYFNPAGGLHSANLWILD